MKELINSCPTCGRQMGACTHTTEGQVTPNSARPDSAVAAVHTAPPASATGQGGADLGHRVTIQLTVHTRLADDIKVFYAKSMQGNHEAACQHPLTMGLLRQLPKQIDNAAGYQREIDKQSAGDA